MTNSYPFVGKIPISGAASLSTSEWAETDLAGDNPSLPAQTPMAWAKTDLAGDTDNAEINVIGWKVIW